LLRLSPRLIDAYLATDEPWDKAGAYAIQGLAGSFVRRIDGSVSNVIGSAAGGNPGTARGRRHCHRAWPGRS
jgi:hypothetical protein